jgi:hypothetical protein
MTAIEEQKWGKLKRGKHATLKKHAPVVMSEEWPGQRYRLIPAERWPATDDTPHLPDKEPLRDAHYGLAHHMGSFKHGEMSVTGGGTYNIYRIPDAPWQYMKHCIEHSDSMLPCGHRGLKNTPEGYVCGLDLCDKLFTREEVAQ